MPSRSNLSPSEKDRGSIPSKCTSLFCFKLTRCRVSSRSGTDKVYPAGIRTASRTTSNNSSDALAQFLSEPLPAPFQIEFPSLQTGWRLRQNLRCDAQFPEQFTQTIEGRRHRALGQVDSIHEIPRIRQPVLKNEAIKILQEQPPSRAAICLQSLVEIASRQIALTARSDGDIFIAIPVSHTRRLLTGNGVVNHHLKSCIGHFFRSLRVTLHARRRNFCKRLFLPSLLDYQMQIVSQDRSQMKGSEDGQSVHRPFGPNRLYSIRSGKETYVAVSQTINGTGPCD